MLPERSALNKSQFFAYFCVFLLLHVIVAYLNDHHLEQQSNFTEFYVGLARYWKGEVRRNVLTYPIWGYSAVLFLLPSYSAVIVPQVILGALAQAALFLRLRQLLPEHRHLLTVLFIAAVPWYLLNSVKWPQAFAGSLVIFAILLLEKAIRFGSVSKGLAAGTLFGLALYFRCEFLYLSLFLMALICIAKLANRLDFDLPPRPAIACVIAAWVVLIPWGIHYYKQTGRFSLTASQGGMVAFISLGQLPNNPWDATYDDQYAFDYLREKGITVAPQSDSGDRILMTEFKSRVMAHPVAYFEKAIRNVPVTLVSGFYSGEMPLTGEQKNELAALKGTAKSLDWSGTSGVRTYLPHVDKRARAAFLFWVFAKVVGSLFVILSTIGLVWVGIRQSLSPLIFLLGGYITYQGVLMSLLATEPRYLNGLYLAMVPFFMLPATTLLKKLRLLRPVPGVRSATSQSQMVQYPS